MDAPDQIVAVAAVLEKFKGNTNHELACQTLGWTKTQLFKFQRENKEALRRARKAVTQQAATVVPPSDVDVMMEDDGPKPAPLVSDEPSDMDLATMVAAQDAKLEAGFRATKMRPAAVERGMALQKHGHSHFGASIDIASAALNEQIIELSLDLTGIEKRLSAVRAYIELLGDAISEERNEKLKEEASLARQLVDVSHAIKGSVDVTFRGAAQFALIRARLGGGQRKTNGNEKPCFTPVTREASPSTIADQD